MSQARNNQTIFAAAATLPLLLACSSDVVDLGNDGLSQSLERGTLCADSPFVRGPVDVSSQEQLEALRGCEEVRGDLAIRIYEGTDLSPLSSLRTVTGRFTLGQTPETTLENEASYEEDEALRDQIAAAGWLTSLHGVESLERVGSLELDRVGAPDLQAFSNLRNLGNNDDPEYAGNLSIRRAGALVNLAGLENAGGVADMFIQDNPALESLFGLRITENVPGFVALDRNPRLTDLFALARLEIVGVLGVTGCGMPNLDALRGLQIAESIDIRDNPELIELDAMSNVRFGDMTIEANPKLVQVPTFEGQMGNSRLRIAGNALLSGIELRYPREDAQEDVEGRAFFFNKDWIEVVDNPRLQSITIAYHPVDDSDFGVATGQVFAVHRNAALWFVDLGTLRRLDLLSIGDNPALTDVAFADLEQVDEIAVTNNPLLATAALRAVPTFQATFSGNADDPPPAPAAP